MLRLGLLDFDTSHSVEFTKRLNHCDEDPAQWVDGARVVVGCPGTSLMSPERIPGFTEEMIAMGVPLVENPAEMIGQVDAMLIEALDGSVHLERARPFLEAGIPCFVDKPFACSLDDARRIVDLAARKNVPIFSASALRYAPELVAFLKEPNAAISGAITYGPAPLKERNPGLFHYGIHVVEALYTLLGPGCERVTCISTADADMVTGHWKDGRIGSMRGSRRGATTYGAIVFGEKETTVLSMDTKYVYRELLKQVVGMFQTGRAPLDIAVTLEIIAFIEAAWRSARNGGTGVTLAF